MPTVILKYDLGDIYRTDLEDPIPLRIQIEGRFFIRDEGIIYKEVFFVDILPRFTTRRSIRIPPFC